MASEDDRSDEERFARYGRELAAGIEEALPGWVARNVERLLRAAGRDIDSAVVAAMAHAGEQAQDEIGRKVRALLAADVDEQTTNPLSIVRSAVRYPTDVLEAAGVPPVVRDEFAERRFPDDPYDLTPAAFADVDPDLLDLGLRWGAAKAYLVKKRHQGGSRD